MGALTKVPIKDKPEKMGICLYLRTELDFSCSAGDAAFPPNGRDVGFPQSAPPA